MSLPSNTCGGCRQAITTKQFLKCCACGMRFDLECANVTTKGFNLLSPAVKQSWKCAECRSAEPKKDNSNTPVRSADDGVTMRRGATALSPPDDQVDMSITMPPVSHLNTTALNETIDIADAQMLFYELRQFREEYRENRSSDRRYMELLTESLIKINTRLDNNDKKYEQLQARMDRLEQQITEHAELRASALTHNVEQSLVDSVASLKAELNERDQDLLLNDIEITCIPEQTGESLPHIAITLADKLGVKLACEDLVSVSRAGPLAGQSDAAAAPAGGPRPRPVVVRLTRRALRDELIRAARVRRGATTEGTDLPGPVRRFFVNERLTKVNRHLFRRTRELATQHRWRFAWTKDGRIYVRRLQDSPRHRIRSEQDLASVFGLGSVGSSGN